MEKPGPHDAYLAATPEDLRPLLVGLRATLARTLPDADHLMIHGMPGFGFGRTVIAGYAAFSRQCGLYVDKAAIAGLAEEIAAAGLKATKTGVTFSAKQPIPQDLVARLALASRRALGL